MKRPTSRERIMRAAPADSDEEKNDRLTNRPPVFLFFQKPSSCPSSHQDLVLTDFPPFNNSRFISRDHPFSGRAHPVKMMAVLPVRPH